MNPSEPKGFIRLLQQPRPRSLVLPSLFLVATFVSALSLSRIALHTSHILLLLPFLSFVLLTCALLVKKVAALRRRGGGTRAVLEGWRGSRRDWTAAAAWSICEATRVLAARENHVTIWGALQTYLLPLLIYLDFFTSETTPFLLGGAALAGAVSLQLWLVQASAPGIACSIVQIATEAWRWRSLRLMKEEHDSEERILRTSAYSTITSLFIFLLTTIFGVTSSSVGYRVQAVELWTCLFPLSSAVGLYILSEAVEDLSGEPMNISLVLTAIPPLVLGAGMLLTQDGAEGKELRHWLMGTFIVGVVVMRLVGEVKPTAVASPLFDEEEEDFGKERLPPTPTARPRHLIGYLALFPLALYFLALVSPVCPLPFGFCRAPSSLPSLDLVFAHYDRPLNEVKAHMKLFLDLPFAQQRKLRVFVYEKGETPNEELWTGLGLEESRGDQIVRLDNWGREGGTYLRHILAHYSSNDTSPSTFADHTLFAQSHLAWHWIALHRMSSLHSRTGFISLGPYISHRCGEEDQMGSYGGIHSIWEEVRGKECEGEQTGTYSGQFVVSRERILGNSRESYQKLDDMLEAPDDDPIHKQLWGPNGSGGRSNPTFGHSLERGWPIIFNCSEPELAKSCPEGVWKIDECQCRD